VLDFQARTLSVDGKPATLSSSEFALLKIFVNHALRTLTRERLLELLHGPEYDGTDRGIDVQVAPAAHPRNGSVDAAFHPDRPRARLRVRARRRGPCANPLIRCSGGSRCS
jgi:hypothetical protein